VRWCRGVWERQRFPDVEHGLGLFHFLRGEPASAAARFADAIRAGNGAYYELYSNLGSALLRLGRPAEAVRCFEIALADAPDDALTRRLHAQARAAGSSGAAPPR
jgi:tetratricopeptide (TPR) repeat protein